MHDTDVDIRPDFEILRTQESLFIMSANAQTALSKLEERTQILQKTDLGKIEERINNACKNIDTINKKLSDYEQFKEKIRNHEKNIGEITEFKNTLPLKITVFLVKCILWMIAILGSISYSIAKLISENPSTLIDILNKTK